ncbi:hypothetical protein EES45_23420 [Streptomyces sp. ADI97-07]|nr:hypothetical protein EES45_23420 [Streptomyces sp. ADI97-07]
MTTASTPWPKWKAYSAKASPNSAGTVPLRYAAGRYWFSARKVYAPTFSPAAWASASRVSGGTSDDLSGPIHCAYEAISRSPAGVAISW